MNNQLNITNDITAVDKDNVLQKINSYTEFSLSFFVLLITSTIICTLGLLINSSPVVIGGMIIAPIIWPLMKITAGISLGRKKLVLYGLFLFGISILITLVVASAITLLSPIKATNPEILSRIQPTIIDLIIALAAGGIAALAIIKKKISDSLAGVAIATALTPPLCVSGIGIALWNPSIASGAFLLFLSNVIAIIFVASIIFILFGVRLRKEKPFTFEALSLIGLVLILVSIPLINLLQHYSFQTTAHQTAQKILEESFKDINRMIVIKNIKTTIGSSTNKDVVAIDAEILIPDQADIDYEQKEALVDKLEKELKKPIELNLRIQRTIALESKDQKLTGDTQKELTKAFQDIITARTDAISVESLDVYQNTQTNKWVVDATLIGDPDIELSETHRIIIEQLLASRISQAVALNIELVSRIKLKSAPDLESEQIRQFIYQFLTTKNNDMTISGVTVVRENSSTVSVKLDVILPRTTSIAALEIERLKRDLEEKYKKVFLFTVDITEKDSYRY